MKWQVIQVKTGEEKAIAQKLAEYHIRTMVPIENRPIHAGGAWGSKEYPLFPGYVFLLIEYNAENYYRVKGIPGVAKLLPGTLSYLEAEWIHLLTGRKGAPLEPTLVKEADGKFEIQEGILSRFASRIVKMDKRNRRAVIELSICGEKKEVQLGIRLPTEEEAAPDAGTDPEADQEVSG